MRLELSHQCAIGFSPRLKGQEDLREGCLQSLACSCAETQIDSTQNSPRGILKLKIAQSSPDGKSVYGSTLVGNITECIMFQQYAYRL